MLCFLLVLKLITSTKKVMRLALFVIRITQKVLKQIYMKILLVVWLSFT